jgi:hypothetical protein
MEKRVRASSIEYTQATGGLEEAMKAGKKKIIKIGSRGITAHQYRHQSWRHQWD